MVTKRLSIKKIAQEGDGRDQFPTVQQCACNGCHACDPLEQCRRSAEDYFCLACAKNLIISLDNKPPLDDFQPEAVALPKDSVAKPWYQGLRHEEFLRALGIFHCKGCDIFLGKNYILHGKDRWCDECFWDGDCEESANRVSGCLPSQFASRTSAESGPQKQPLPTFTDM